MQRRSIILGCCSIEEDACNSQGAKMYDIELEPEPIRHILNYHKLFEIVKVVRRPRIYTQITTP